MSEHEGHAPHDRVNVASVVPAGQAVPRAVLPPLSATAARHESRLTEFVEARAVPRGGEDLDRGDNHWEVQTNEQQTALRMLGRTVHPDPASACAEAIDLGRELEAAGYTIRATSRLGAAAATGPAQEPAGWRALLDLRLGHPAD